LSRTVTRSLAPRRHGLLTRMRAALRSFWTGHFSLKDAALNRLFGVSSRSSAGPVVNEHTVFLCAAVYDACNQISSDTAKLPLNLLKVRQSGGNEHYTASKTYRLLKYKPNAEQTPMVFRRAITLHALIFGTGYAEIERDGLGRASALWHIESWRVKPERDDRGRLQYRIDGQEVITHADMLVVPGLSMDGVSGMEFIQVAREAVGLALASQQFAAAFFGNGTRFGGVLTTDNPDLDEDQKKDIMEAVEAVHAKADKAFRMLVLAAGYKYQETGVKPSDAQMKEIREQQVEEVARFFNIPVHKLKNLQRATNNNIEQQDLEYYKGCLLNWITLWEQELDTKLVPALETGLQYFKHNANAFLRGDIKSRYEALGMAKDRGVINADEWRELEDMNPQPDGQGKLYLVQSAQIPVDKLAALADAQIAATKAKSAPPAAPAPPKDDDAAKEAEDRAAAAQLMADEARRLADDEREKRIRAEASGQVTAEELERLRASERTATGQAAQLEALAAQLRADIERETAARAAAETARQAEADARTAAEREAADAKAAAVRATELLEEAQSLRAAGESTVQELRTELEEVKAAHELSLDEVQALITEQAQLRATAAAAAADTSAAREAETQLAGRLAEAEETAATAAARAAEVAEALAAAQSDLAALQARERARQVATIAAHRALVVDAMGRMTRREAEQARRHQATPEKLRSWLEGFGDVHAALCTEAILPAVRTHLAWMGTEGEPADLASELVREHLEAFTTKLRGVLEAPPEDFHAELERVLDRWETTRATQVAEGLMEKEIRHVGAQ
jgi:HK97 family phage portal protein